MVNTEAYNKTLYITGKNFLKYQFLINFYVLTHTFMKKRPIEVNTSFCAKNNKNFAKNSLLKVWTSGKTPKLKNFTIDLSKDFNLDLSKKRKRKKENF